MHAGLLVLSLVAGECLPDGPVTATGKAPPGHAVLKTVKGGAYFVAKPLKERYDAALARLQWLQGEIAQGRLSTEQARLQLAQIEAQLTTLRESIDASKVLVKPLKVIKQTETWSFNPGPQRLLVITADNVRLEGWDGPGVKCVLEKTVLQADDRPVAEHLQALKLVHRHGRSAEVVGKTDLEREAEWAEARQSEASKSLSAVQLAERKRFMDETARSYTIYGPFQGRDFDMVEIEGLGAGNRPLAYEAQSPSGGAISGSVWQRDAALTVYVPPLKMVALRGCAVRLAVLGLQADLVVTSDGSRDIDYEGSFTIRGVAGSVALENSPIQAIANIKGSVHITSTLSFDNTGAQSQSRLRQIFTPPARACVVRQIQGDLTAWLERSDLKLEAISGRIDVRNEYGHTQLVGEAGLHKAAHRIVTESGSVTVKLSKGALESLPVMAVTNCGGVRTTASGTQLREVSFSSAGSRELGRRSWHGLRSPGDGMSPPPLDSVTRPEKVLQGLERTPGLDLISRAGVVEVIIEPRP